jgi:allophanate hydrolase subunit 2
MDSDAFRRAGDWLGGAGATGVEFTRAGLTFVLEHGPLTMAGNGGDFSISINGVSRRWPLRVVLKTGDRLNITPGSAGNYGYLRFDREVDVPLVMGSRATNSIAGLGGFEGRPLAPNDLLRFGARGPLLPSAHPSAAPPAQDVPLRVIWGLHADRFPQSVRESLVSGTLKVSTKLDRMGVRLEDPSGIFAATRALSLVSDAIVPGDIQILGDGTPIILMRDHQPTGGYPRIATVITADLDRLAQMRPGSALRFLPVTVAHAHALAGATR